MIMSFESISIIGLGYIGLPTAAMLASRMGNVIGVDVNPHVVRSVNAGELHVVEPGLDALLEAAVAAKSLRAVECPEPADAFIIAVPTPITEDHKPDMSHVRDAALSLAPVLRQGNLLILESTSPVGTTEQMAEWLAEARPDLSFPQQAGDEADVQIAYCPERILPGNMLHELVHNDRVVGGMSGKATEMAVSLYALFVKGEIVTTKVRTAEMCKLAENSFRDVNIAYANELSMICDKLDIDVDELIRLANRHPRVNILQPGCGVGGHCIPVDPWFIVDSAPEEARLITMAREVNDSKPLWVVEKVKAQIAEVLADNPEKQIENVTVACVGLAYKANVDDLRNSPAISIVKAVAKIGCMVEIILYPTELLPQPLADINMHVITQNDALALADVVCILVQHEAFCSAKQNFIAHKNVLNFAAR